MAIFALRVSVRAPHFICVIILAALVGFPTFEILGYVLIGMVTVWFGCSEFVARLPKPRVDYSYGVYIYGFPIQQIIASIWPSAGPYEMFAAAMLTVIPCAILSWHVVELPAQIAGKSTAHLFSGTLQPNHTVLSVIRQNWRGVALPVSITVLAILMFSASTLRLQSIDAAALDIKIVAFGPTPIVHGQPFNQQPNGESTIWVKLDRPAAKDFVLVLAGEQLATVVSGDLLTAAVPSKLFNSPGSLQLLVEAVQHARKAQSKPVIFKVQ